jgi:hypothetical protein
MSKQLLALTFLSVLLSLLSEPANGLRPHDNPAPAFPINSDVEVLWAGQWWATTIVDTLPGDMYRVRWPGSTAGIPVPGTSLRLSWRKRAQQAVCDEFIEVELGGEWWPAISLRRRKTDTYIHFEGWGNSWDQWVANHRVRMRTRKDCGVSVHARAPQLRLDVDTL